MIILRMFKGIRGLGLWGNGRSLPHHDSPHVLPDSCSIHTSWASWNYRKINKWRKEMWDWVDSLPGLPAGAVAVPSEAPRQFPKNKKVTNCPRQESSIVANREAESFPFPLSDQIEEKQMNAGERQKEMCLGELASGSEPLFLSVPFSVLQHG